MNQAGLFSIGIRVVATALVLVSLSVTTLTHANESPGASRYVPVVYDGLVRYMLDTTTLKRHTGLSGNTLIDVWIEGRLDVGAGSRIQAFLGGYPPGVDYEKVGTVRVRCLFRIDAIPHQEALTAVIERQYFDLNDKVIRQDPFNPPANPSEWRSLNEMEEKALQVIMQQPAFQAVQRLDLALRNSAIVKELDEGFLGRLWGIRPADFPDARHLADITPRVMVYGADLELSPILGPVSALSAPRLVFAKEDGLTQAIIPFAPRDYGRVHRHLVSVLGEPAPIMYELWAARVDFDERSEWLVGRNTRVVLTSRLKGATVEIARRDAFSPAGSNFAETLAAAQLKQAQEHERLNRILEASSSYQQLLNGTDSYHDFTPTAQERLAAYSVRPDAVEFLGKYRGYAFSRLMNTATSVQHWLRIDLDHEARAALQKQRPVEEKPQDALANIAAVLCRGKAVPAAGKFVVVEQVWLDSANRIIGGRPAWAPQDGVWPAPYIRQVCEDFLKAWFTVGDTSEAGPKKANE